MKRSDYIKLNLPFLEEFMKYHDLDNVSININGSGKVSAGQYLRDNISINFDISDTDVKVIKDEIKNNAFTSDMSSFLNGKRTLTAKQRRQNQIANSPIFPRIARKSKPPNPTKKRSP